MNARVFDPAVRSSRSRPIPVFYRERQLSSPCPHRLPSTVFPIHIVLSSVSSATRDHRVDLCTIHVHAEKNVPSFILKQGVPGWVTDSLNFISSGVSRRWSCQITGESRLEFHTWYVQVLPRIDQKLTGSPLLATQRATASLRRHTERQVLTSASMIDLFAPSSHFVIAREITVRIATRPGVPANNSPSLSPVLNSRATRGALAIGVPSSCNHPLDANHLLLFIPFHGFPGDNTIHFHPFESFQFLPFCFNHNLLTHVRFRVP